MAIMNEIWAEFHTGSDTKDRGNGISETYIRPSDGLVLGSNNSWGRDMEYEKGPSWGQRFDISRHSIDLTAAKTIRYRYNMDNDDGWKVSITIKARTADGNEHVLGGDYRKIGNGKPRQGEISIGGHLGFLGGDLEPGSLYRVQIIDEDENVLEQQTYSDAGQVIGVLNHLGSQDTEPEAGQDSEKQAAT